MQIVTEQAELEERLERYKCRGNGPLPFWSGGGGLHHLGRERVAGW